MTMCGDVLRASAKRALWLLLLVVVLPAAAFAQGPSITGVAKDTSGAVLPGVTVEAASPALIEKVRTVVSDGSGQYRFVDLKPGVYTVTFTLTGFNTFKREGVELAGDFTATINADMKVGSLEETITVSGEAPIVDVQGIQRQRVLTNDVVEAVPTGKYFVNLGILIPGVSASCSAACQSGTSQDTGGSMGDNSSTLVVHGSRFRDQRISLNNMTVRGSTGYMGVTGPNIEAMQETQIDTSGADASIGTGGVRINVVPKDGGNTIKGGFFFSGTNEHFQGDNITQDLTDRGLRSTASVKSLHDIAPTIGGPIAKDKLWFFVSYRHSNNVNYTGNTYYNLTPTGRTYTPDLSQRATYGNVLPMAGIRLTWQANAKNKFAASTDYRDRCQCPNLANGGQFGISPEAAIDFKFRPQQVTIAAWSAPVTNRLLLDATYVRLQEAGGNGFGQFHPPVGTLRVVDQAPPASYLGVTTYGQNAGLYWQQYPYNDTAFNATYVTGSHAFKAGIEFDWGQSVRNYYNYVTGPIDNIRVSSATGVPVPNQFTVFSTPFQTDNRSPADGGLYLQDKWTFKHVTLAGGLRWDFFKRYTNEITEGPTAVEPNRNFTFPREDVVNYKDLNPRMGMAWDVFGTGKTAVKASLNRYIQDLSLLANSGGSVMANFQISASRTWTDSNGNFYPDCDYANKNAQNLTASGGDICGAFTGTSANFGTSVPTAVNDSNVNNGFGRRGYDWEFSTSVQQELIPRKLSVDLGFFRRWYGNFTTSNNPLTAASDYGSFSVVVPAVNPVTGVADLPNAGQTISGFFDASPAVASLVATNQVSFSDKYGKQTETWQGIDLSGNARLGGGTIIQGGLSTGKQVTDNCAVVAQVPEAAVPGVSLNGAPGNIAGPLGGPFCHQEQPWLLQVKGLGTYTVPKIGIQLSGTFQSVNGPQLAATLVVPCGAGSSVAAQLGRNCTAAGGNVTVNLVSPGSLIGERLNQFDFRVGKVFRFAGGRRITPSIDLFNLFNGNSVLTQTSAYPTTASQSRFGVPTFIQQARLLKFTVSASF